MKEIPWFRSLCYKFYNQFKQKYQHNYKFEDHYNKFSRVADVIGPNTDKNACKDNRKSNRCLKDKRVSQLSKISLDMMKCQKLLLM